MSALTDLVSEFVDQLSAAIETDALARARAKVETVLGNGHDHSRRLTLIGRPGRPRKKPPIQLCPVPGCRRPAAPVFGMVCAEHKKVSKAKIRQYREARRAAKKSGKAVPKRTVDGAKAKKPASQQAKAKRKAKSPTRSSGATRKRAAGHKKAPTAAAPTAQAVTAAAAA